MGEILRHSQAPTTNHNSYQPASPGFSEARYPNMAKTGTSSIVSGGRFSENLPYAGTDTASYRSASPPIDERTGMMQGVMNPESFQPGHPSPSLSGLGSPGSNSAGFPSPMYYETTHEADGQSRYVDEPPGYPQPPTSHPNPDANQGLGPHELAVPSRHPSSAAANVSSLDPNSPRPFSFTDSESGYARNRDEKTMDSFVSR